MPTSAIPRAPATSSNTVLSGAAEAVAASLVDGVTLAPTSDALRDLRDAMLAENRDSSDSAKTRCTVLRVGFAAALRASLAKRPETASLLGDGGWSRTRVEVRGTAGRIMAGGEAFTVGRAGECDVQVWGDATVSRLQFIAVSFPKAIVVIDAWSTGGTRTVNLSPSNAKTFPMSLPGRRLAFALAHEERATVTVGSKTTLTLGPEMVAGDAVADSSSLQPYAVSLRCTGRQDLEAPTGDLATRAMNGSLEPTGNSEGPADAAPRANPDAGGDAVTDSLWLPDFEAPAGDLATRAANGSLQPTGNSEDPLHVRTAVVPKGPDSVGLADINAGSTSQSAVGSTRGSSKLFMRTVTALRAALRMRRVADERSRLMWRCRAAARTMLISDSQRKKLEERLQSDGDGPDEVREVLDGLGVMPAPDVPSRSETLSWQCTLCHRPQRASGWLCPFQHRFCCDCMFNLAVRSPYLGYLGCPHAEGCGYRLGLRDLEVLGVPPRILEAFSVGQPEAGELRSGLAVHICGLEALPELNGREGTCEDWLPERNRWAVRIAGEEVKALRPENLTPARQVGPVPLPESGAESDATGSKSLLLRCPRRSCGASLTLNPDEPRRRFDCTCGAPSLCTGCGESPYHYHAQCEVVQQLRERWLGWRHGGRTTYCCLRSKALRAAHAQRRALKEAADTAVTAEGGSNGAVRITPPPPQRLSVARAKFVQGEGVRHFFTRCALCGSGGRCIVGPRFRCIHCPAFDCCLRCEARLAGLHDQAHTFQIMFECEFDWGRLAAELPPGTRARLREHPVSIAAAAEGDAMAASSAHTTEAGAQPLRKRRGHGLEGVIRGFKRGRYELELKNGGGMRHVLPQELQPLLTQKQAQRLLGRAELSS